MSGFETSKFVDLNESLETHLSCGICYGIYNKPVETQCGHTFCEQCIRQWYENNVNKTCPYCKQQLGNKRKRNTRNDNSFDSNVLFSKSKKVLLIIDLINDLKIKCDFVSNGCQEVVKLVSLSKHLEECNYNLCETCGLKMGKKYEHNCIELLKKERDYYKQQSFESKKEVEKYRAEFIVAKNQLRIKSMSFEEEKNKLKEEISKSEKEKEELKAQIEKIKINNNVNDEVIVDSEVEQYLNLANNDFIEEVVYNRAQKLGILDNNLYVKIEVETQFSENQIYRHKKSSTFDKFKKDLNKNYLDYGEVIEFRYNNKLIDDFDSPQKLNITDGDFIKVKKIKSQKTRFKSFKRDAVFKNI
jgi:hypothetical protein